MTKAPYPSTVRFFGLATALAVFSACGESPITPQPLDSDPLLSAAGNPVVLSATGGGNVTGPSGIQDQFSFHAKKRADGTVTGEVKFTSEFFAPNQKQRGDVVCMASLQVAGVDFVAIGADIPSPDPGNTGPFFVLSVIDGGEGANAPPDKMLPDFLPPQAYVPGPPDNAADSCDLINLPDFVLNFFADIDNGNIQVKP